MIPTGYSPHTRKSPLTEPWEPLFSQEVAGAIRLALEIREAHCNSRGFAHGGLISALADNAMGASAVIQARQTGSTETKGAVTVSLSLDFLDSAQIGDTLEFLPSVLKTGKSIGFVECRVVAAERLIARGSATFKFV